MADEQARPAPGPPSGFQRPGIPGAGNLLDPEVRGELREQVQAAVPKGLPQSQGGAAPHPAPPAEPPAAPPATPSPVQHRAGPFPHGDVDLSGFAANVPAGPIRLKRGRSRSYYFLKQREDTAREEPPLSVNQPSADQKPG